MREIILEKKTGFETSLPFKIFEPNGNEFFSSEFTNKIQNGEVLKFNLPPGKWSVEGSIRRLSEPVKFSSIKLPPPERRIKKRKYQIIFGHNKNKCTIYYKAGLIVFDNAFKDAPLYIKFDIYYHELGHHLYKTEKFADLYAINKMLQFGFNPSQIGRAKLFSLSSKSYERKENGVNAVLQTKQL